MFIFCSNPPLTLHTKLKMVVACSKIFPNLLKLFVVGFGIKMNNSPDEHDENQNFCPFESP